MLLKDTKALEISDKTPTVVQVNRRLAGTATGVLIPETSAQRRMPHAIQFKVDRLQIIVVALEKIYIYVYISIIAVK